MRNHIATLGVKIKILTIKKEKKTIFNSDILLAIKFFNLF